MLCKAVLAAKRKNLEERTLKCLLWRTIGWLSWKANCFVKLSTAFYIVVSCKKDRVAVWICAEFPLRCLPQQSHGVELCDIVMGVLHSPMENIVGWLAYFLGFISFATSIARVMKCGNFFHFAQPPSSGREIVHWQAPEREKGLIQDIGFIQPLTVMRRTGRNIGCSAQGGSSLPPRWHKLTSGFRRNHRLAGEMGPLSIDLEKMGALSAAFPTKATKINHKA